jgi:signal transduction histidine kinase
MNMSSMLGAGAGSRIVQQIEPAGTNVGAAPASKVAARPGAATANVGETMTARSIGLRPHRSRRPRAGRPVALGLLRRAEHVLFVGLLALGVGQSIADHARPWAVTPIGVAVLAWYGAGIAIARRPGGPTVRRRRATLWLVGLTAGWAALVALSPDFVWLVFAIFLLWLQAIPLRRSIFVVLVLAGAAIAAVSEHQGRATLAVVLGPLIGAAVAIVITAVYQDLRGEVEQRERLMAELTAAQQRLAAAQRYAGTLAERERLAHDIHDTVAQGLSSIVLLLRAVCSASAPLAEPVRRQLDAAAAAAKTALDDTRRVVRALAPAELAGQPLAAALQRLVADTAPVGIQVGFDVDGDPYELPTSTAVALLRTAQGALGNVIAHSMAQHAHVTLTYQADRVALDVADDGRGFDPAAPADESAAGTGIGLTAMRTRLAEVGGTLAVESSPGAGAAISATIPTEAADA